MGLFHIGRSSKMISVKPVEKVTVLRKLQEQSPALNNDVWVKGIAETVKRFLTSGPQRMLGLLTHGSLNGGEPFLRGWRSLLGGCFGALAPLYYIVSTLIGRPALVWVSSFKLFHSANTL